MRREFGAAIRQAGLARVGYRCQRCGVQERLEFHHVGLPFDRSAFNCAVLCVACHRRHHREKLVQNRAT
jgi:hypothetical protein